jgi:hypothetical protein
MVWKIDLGGARKSTGIDYRARKWAQETKNGGPFDWGRSNDTNSEHRGPVDKSLMCIITSLELDSECNERTDERHAQHDPIISDRTTE